MADVDFEKQIELLSAELSAEKARSEQLSRQVERVVAEGALKSQLILAGAVDPDAAVVLARAQMEEGQDNDVDKVVATLRQEKGYLFTAEDHGALLAGRKSSGVKYRQDGHAMLKRAAAKAAQSGGRREVQEYMRLRRQG